MITGSNYPHFERNLNMATPLYGGSVDASERVAIRLLARENQPTMIRLPMASLPSSVNDVRMQPHKASLAVGRNALHIELPRSEVVSMMVSDLLGRIVQRSDGELRAAGPHTILLDTDALTAGFYVCRVTMGEEVRVVTFRR